MTTETILTDEIITELAAKHLWAHAQFIGAGEVYYEGEIEFARAIEQAVLQSPEIQEMRDALNQCRFALEPYDDIKPRDWKTDRENLRYAHRVVCAAIEQKS